MGNEMRQSDTCGCDGKRHIFQKSLVLPRNWLFHGKLAKKRHVFGLKGSQQPRKYAACLSISPFPLTILID